MSRVTVRHRRVEPSGRVQAADTVPVPLERGSGKLRKLLIVLAATTIVLIALFTLRMRVKQRRSIRMRHVERHNTPKHERLSVVEPGTEGEIPVQFDEDGEMDLATLQRMLDIMYRGPQDPEGYIPVKDGEEESKGAYRFRKPAEEAAAEEIKLL